MIQGIGQYGVHFSIQQWSVYAFALGGVMKFLFSTVPFLKGRQGGIWYILGAGMLGYQAVSWWIGQTGKNRPADLYKVKLRGRLNEIELDALPDCLI